MALSIIRNDITKMEVDAIVNSTNEQLLVSGVGVNASIHYAAGPELAVALKKIGSCPTGSCVITESFNIHTCKYIIHAVGPIHKTVQREVLKRELQEERLQLENCYRAIFAMARKNACTSIAMPLISAGANGFPKEVVYRIATSVAREFLLSMEGDDMMIYIVLYGQDAVGISRKVNDAVRQHISEQYEIAHRQELLEYYDKVPCASPYELNRRRSEKDRPFRVCESAMTAPIQESKGKAGEEDYRAQDKSFAEMCEWWCEKKRLSKHDFYTYSNITKATFWSMKNNPDQVPKKTNVLACAIGLKLDLEQTKDLMQRAGMALSPYYTLDMIVEYFITKKQYDIFEINAVLFDEDLSLLGAVAREKKDA